MTAPLNKPARLGPVPAWLAIATVLCVIALTFARVPSGGFSYWDDEDTIARNPDLIPPTWAGLAERWRRPQLHIYIPLTQTAWHALALISPTKTEGGVSTLSPLPFKLANVCVHAATSVLVLLILRRMVGPRWPSVAGALLFAVHPVQVETVAWASGLKDLLSTMFAAGCVLTYIGDERNLARPRGRNIASALTLFVAAALSKPTAVVVPAMLLAIDVLWLRRPAVQSVARLLPFVFVGICIAIFARLVQPPVAHGTEVSLVWRPVVAMDALWFYACKLIAPVGLAFDYGLTARRMVGDAQAHPLMAGTRAILICVAAVIAVVARRNLLIAALGVLLAIIAVAPVLGFTHFDFSHYSVVADHYLYLPMLGVALALAALISLDIRRERVWIGVVGASICCWTVMTSRQTDAWLDGRAVSLRTLCVNDRSYASWCNLGLYELRVGNLDAAQQDAERAIAIAPDDAYSAFLMANILSDRGETENAIDWVRRAIRATPYAAEYHHLLAILLGKSGRLGESLAELNRTLEINPRFADASGQAVQLRIYIRQQSITTRPASEPANH